MKLKIRDGHATLNGDKTEHEMPSGVLDIIADDGRALFSITLQRGGEIAVHVSGHCKHENRVLEDAILVKPKASNMIVAMRLESDFSKSK